MNIVTIKEVKGVVKCADDGTAEHVFNVKNATDSALKVGMQISASDPTKAEWLSIEGPAERELEVETMTQVAVKIQAPPECAPGKYSYRLRVFDPQSPGERFTDGETVHFEVSKTVVEPTPEPDKKPFKWWIPAAIAAGVIVVGVVVWLLWPTGLKIPDFTQGDWTKAKAEEFLKKHKIKYTTELQQDPNPKSEVEILGQKPEPDTKLKAEETVTLKIAGVMAPALKNLKFSAALVRIDSLGLSFDTDKDLKIQTVSNTNQDEKVLDQNPPHRKLVPKKSAMKLTVGRLPNKKFIIKDLPKLKTMKSIKISPIFMKREVAPE
jgi:beta-lactam-binding protein with PASTA domain